MAKRYRVQNKEEIPPPDSFVEQANVATPSVYEAFERNWPACWERAANLLDWEQRYGSVLKPLDDPPYYRWFADGKLNAAHNCVDRHVNAGRGDRDALRWISESGVTRTYTFADLKREVNDIAAALRTLGVNEDEPVALHLPRIPELPITMLACARLGVPHVVVFVEYSADILASFIRETGARTLVTCDGYSKEGTVHNLSLKIARCLDDLDSDLRTVVVDHVGYAGEMEVELTYGDLLAEHRGAEIAPVVRNADDSLFVCYASGPVGEPVGMKHVTGEYLSYVAWTAHAVLDVKADDTFWCPAGIEWITGHSYVVYGPLLLGASTILYEEAPTYPNEHRPWEIIEENEVTQFYTTPTAIRTFMDWGSAYPASHDLSSLRLLGTVGQRIDPRAWHWFYEHVGNGRCPIVDTWYQAETGGITISTIPGVCEMKPGSVGPELPGIDASVVDANGNEVPPGEAGYLVFERPWPGLFRPIESSEYQAREYWAEFGDDTEQWVYFSEDGATVDENGYITIMGRLDDVINIGSFSKNRVHATEIERVIADVDGVKDVAVISGLHAIKGEAPYAFVVAETGVTETIRSHICDRVERNLAAAACPKKIYLVSDLPRTYSGGVLRHVLEDLHNDEPLGDTNMLRNPRVLDHIATEIQYRGSLTDDR